MSNDSSIKKIRINSIISILSQIITLILGLIIPKIILNNYGSDTNGLTNTISQIFVYVGLLETGISTSARNALYKPIKDNDKGNISYWLSLASKYFRKISLIYLVIVLSFSFAMPLLLKTHISYWTIFFYILFEALTSVVSFYFLNTWICFLNAKGENYIVNIISLGSKLLMYAVKIILSIFGLNIVLIQIGYFIVSLFQLLIYSIYMNKHYSWINYKVPTFKDKLPDKNSYLLTEIAWTVFSSTDMIILSIFVSTEMSSVYSVYNMVFVALSGLMDSIFVALNYNLGKQYKINKEQYVKVHDVFNNFFIGVTTALMCVSYWLIIPFIKLYTRGIDDVEYVYTFLPFLFCLIQILSCSRKISSNLFGIAGYAKSNATFSILESIMNITLSVVFVNFWGIMGVLIATVIALIPKVLFLNIQGDNKILERSNWKTFKIIGLNLCVFIITVIAKLFVNISFDSFMEFCLIGFVLVLIYLIIAIVVNYFSNKELFLTIKKVFKKDTD